ncbi:MULTISPECIES: hypothetical protein [unclassified Marinomonas]|uniref:hypothetical protein n=1 Tax=unclassified Marinomonas TaxID=196814 RepID=UPI000A6EE3A2|nr:MULTISPECIES: hypothetical protein [unclassified Marinomonas]
MITSTSIYYQSIETNSSDPTSSYSWKECMHTRTTAKRAVSSGTVRFREKLLRASKTIAIFAWTGMPIFNLFQIFALIF